jgi:hypothetical protein
MHTESLGEAARHAHRERLLNKRITTEANLFTYLWHTLRENSLWILWRRALDWFRRFRLVAILLRAAAFLWGLLQAGALVLFSTALLLVALPLLVSLMLGILITALLETRQSNRRLLRATEGKHVYVLFLPRATSSFAIENARDLARKSNCAVIAVSPYWISSRGITRSHFYCTVRREEESLFLVRKFYFFSLCKHVLAKRKTAYLY